MVGVKCVHCGSRDTQRQTQMDIDSVFWGWGCFKCDRGFWFNCLSGVWFVQGKHVEYRLDREALRIAGAAHAPVSV